MKTMFIINPVSGKGAGKRPFKIIGWINREFKKAKEPFAIRMWDKPKKIDQIIENAIKGKFDVVVAVGGDGTINEIGKRLLDTDIAMGVIPIGSGNGFARHLGYSLRTKKAVKQLLNSDFMYADAGDFGGIPFINAAGIGIDAEVADRFSRSGKRGFATYVQLASKTIMNYKTFDCKLVVDGAREYKWDNLLLIDIANGTQWGNGAKIAPLSQISDGWMEAIILQKTPVMKVPRLIKLLFQGKIYRHPKIKIIRGKTFEIIRKNPGNAHVDGEAVKLGTNIQARVMEKSVKLLVPRRGTNNRNSAK